LKADDIDFRIRIGDVDGVGVGPGDAASSESATQTAADGIRRTGEEAEVVCRPIEITVG